MLAVANFHYIRHDFSAKYPSIFGRTPREFKSQLEVLSRQGNFISLNDLLMKRFSEKDKVILITFDDGLKEQFELARPILNQMGIPFVCFINTINFTEQRLSMVHKIHLLRSELDPGDFVSEIEKNNSVRLSDSEKSKAHLHYNYDTPEVARLKYILNFKMKFLELPNYIDPLFHRVFNEKQLAENLYMSMQQLCELNKQNSLASHGHEHLPLAMLSNKAFQADLEKTQDFFLDHFGERSKVLSYPYGSFDSCKGLSAELKSNAFKYAFTMERAINKNPEKNPFLIARYDCNDLPGGKFDSFKGKNIFEDPIFNSWRNH